MKKKILFTAYSLEYGGIEKSLVNYANTLIENYYVDIILEKKQGPYLKMLDSRVNVIEYKVNNGKLVLFRKIKNRLKLIFWKIKLHNKYDFAANFATYSIPGANLALASSRNNAIWMHANYYIYYNNDAKLMSKFLDSVRARKFKKIVFVSQENLQEVCKHYDGIKEKSIVCNNLFNAEEIIRKSKEKVKLKKYNFVNVGRHEETQKKLSRIINSAKRLKEEKYKFSILFVGDGPDHDFYLDLIKKYKLEEYIDFVGAKENPYPYFLAGQSIILSSEYEGYPVVFLESLVLNKPILSTKVSDYQLIKNYGLFCAKDENSVYKMMKKFLDKKIDFQTKFDYEEYNKRNLNRVINLIEGVNDNE